jgi:hypothetical protein
MSRSYPNTRPTYGTYEWFQRELGIAVGIGANFNHWTHPDVEKIDSLIQRGIHRFYQPAGTGQRFQRGYQWSFLVPLTTLTTSAAYSTGTVTVVAGVATITGGTWPAWAADGDLAISGVQYRASSVNGGFDELTLEDLTVTAAAGTTFSLTRPRYTLDATFESLDGPLTYRVGTGRGTVIPVVSEHGLRSGKQTGSSYPQMAAIYTVTPDSNVGTRWQLELFPAPNAAYVLEYRYKIDPVDLVPGDFPLGGRTNAETILMSCMAILNPALEETFLARLASAIDQDQASHAATNLGQNRDGSDGVVNDHVLRNRSLTPYEGNYYS